MGDKDSSIGRVNRRNVLKATGLGVTAPLLSRRAAGVVGDTDQAASITFEDQRSGGERVTVTTLTTEVYARFRIQNEDSDTIAGPIEFDAGTDLTDYEVDLEDSISETQTLYANLYDEEGQNMVRVSAEVAVNEPVESEEPAEELPGIEPTLVEADPDAGFGYPYYLYAPSRSADTDAKPVLAEPVNSGRPSDNYEIHRREAERLIRGDSGRRLADSLEAPYIVAAFPRPQSDPVDFHHSIHALDDTTMEISDGPLERIDLQLLAMVEDARRRLEDREYPVGDGLMLNGFSASGNFVDRFAALHPEEVTSVTAGGINGMPILPIAEAPGYVLPYHVGVSDIEELTGDPFDLEAFRDVNRFLYMGEFDDSDTIPYDGSFGDGWLREVALGVFGDHMVEDRLPYAKSVSDDAGTASVFRMYEGVGHSPGPAGQDLAEFHRRSLAGDDIAEIRSDLGGNVPELGPHVEYEPRDPDIGVAVTFDGSRSALDDEEATAFEWEFDGSRTVSGSTVTHTFDSPGGHNVTLTVIDASGETHQTTEQVVVGVDDSPVAGGSSVTFEDQESSGTSIVLSEVHAEADARLRIQTEDYDRIAGPIRFEGGEVAEDVRVELVDPILENQRLEAVLERDDDQRSVGDEASVAVDGQPERIAGLEPRLVGADPDAGFEYPYYLCAPPTTSDEPARPVLAEPVNTGTATDDYDRHLAAAERAARGSLGSGREIADRVRAPFVVPAFPRPRSEPVDWRHYVHALDDTTMEISDGPLKRVDLQVLAMVEDARSRLQEAGYPVADGLMLNGFSASGNFVDRFAALHPEEVTSVTAGGINGMPVLPISYADDENCENLALKYPVGVENVASLTGSEFDLEAFRDVNRFLFMGEIDMNDTISYSDAFTDDTLRDTALSVFGRNMQDDRFPYARTIYDAVGADAVFRMYEDTSHRAMVAIRDAVEFHRRSLAGDGIQELRADLGGNAPSRRAAVSVAPREPTIGGNVAFHAAGTEIRNREPVAFEWAIDSETVEGETVTTRFDEPGMHTVTLTVTDDAGDNHRATEYVRVDGGSSLDAVDSRSESDGQPERSNQFIEADYTCEAAGSTEADETSNQTTETTMLPQTSTSTDPTTTQDSTEASENNTDTPGFGVAESLAGVGGAWYVLRHWLNDGDGA